jgi:hypothetical protein
MRRTVFVFIFILLFSCVLDAGEQATTLRVIVQKANIREEPDTSAQIIAQVNLGSLLEAQTKAGEWYEITLTSSSGEKIIGYIHSNLVETFSPETPQPEKPRVQERDVYVEQPRVDPQPAPQYYRERRPVRRATGFKLMGTMGFSKMNISDEEDLPEEFQLKSLTGFGGGLGFEIGFSPNIIFEVDFTYAPGGTLLEADLSDISPGLSIEAKITGAAITAPVLLKIKFLRGTSPYIIGGGEVGYVISQKAVVTIPGVGEEEQDITEDIERLYYGALFGGGFEVDLDYLSFLLEFRYHLGLSNMVKDPPPDSYARSNAMSLVLGIKL